MERRFVHSLRFQVAVGVALPVFLALSALAIFQYARQRQLQTQRLEHQAIVLGEVIRGGLRHEMWTADRAMLLRILKDISRQPSVLRVAIVNAEAEVRLADPPEDFDPNTNQSSPGCVECHRPSGLLDTHSLVITLPGQAPMLRSSTLIPNEPACAGCHDPGQTYLGVLITDFSLAELETDALADLRASLALSAIATVLVTTGVFGLVHWLVVRRVERFRVPLAHFARGDFSRRVPSATGENDELADLTRAVNRMAEDLEQQAELTKHAQLARRQAILEERQRLARELHDGVTQVIGYVSTKAMAARLLLRRNAMEEASEQLRQLEQAAQDVFADVRQAVLDLKTAVDDQHGLLPTLEEYVARFRDLHGLPVELAVAEAARSAPLPAESELQLLRIVQEALTNVRKHSGASRACVKLDLDCPRTATITIADDGRGFDPAAVERDRRPHFGLAIMRERAEAVGGKFEIKSASGAGTRIVVTLPLAERGGA